MMNPSRRIVIPGVSHGMTVPDVAGSAGLDLDDGLFGRFCRGKGAEGEDQCGGSEPF